ncbi:hypothetical protein D3C77_198870 [compost metagenome]
MRHDHSTTVYQDCMRSAALAFLTRHQFQYLPNDPLLLERTVVHLESALEVAPVTARKLAEQAYSELDVIRSRHLFDLSNSSSTKSVIFDPSGDPDQRDLRTDHCRT